MTAEMAGKAAVDTVWGTLRRLKDRWLLLTFVAGALFWARDTYDELARVPALMRSEIAGLSALEAAVTRLRVEVLHGPERDTLPVFGFPGNRHRIDDGVPGAWTVLHWSPVRRLRSDCVPVKIDAFMVDAIGQWFSVETALAPMPVVDGDADLAFEVRIHPRMAPGRARVGVQITSDCGTRQHLDMAPWLPFRVLGG